MARISRMCYESSFFHVMIQGINRERIYAKFFNKVNNRVGYVYRDRYRCENIFTERHLINCIKYIHNNPVKAGLCKYPNEYKY